MKIIFLDIDGVLTSARCNGFHDFDLWAITFLRWACKKGDAKIVISSVWRNDINAFDVFSKVFDEFLHENWRTPNLKDSRRREDEIDKWLQNNPDINEFIIIDDDIEDLRRHESRLIRTSSQDGMLSVHMMELRDRLGIGTFPHPYVPVFRDDVCFFTEREKEEIKKYPVSKEILDG